LILTIGIIISLLVLCWRLQDYPFLPGPKSGPAYDAFRKKEVPGTQGARELSQRVDARGGRTTVTAPSEASVNALRLPSSWSEMLRQQTRKASSGPRV